MELGGSRENDSRAEVGMEEALHPVAVQPTSSSSSSFISPRPHSFSFSSSHSSSSSSAVSSARYSTLCDSSSVLDSSIKFCLPPATLGSFESSTSTTKGGSPPDKIKTVGDYLMSKEGKPEPVEGCRRGDELIQPVNYSAVVEGQLHRSGFPNKNNFAFIRSLKLKSVVTLVPEDYPVENREFLEQEGIQFFQFGIPGNKEPFVHIPDERIVAALATVLDVRNYPMLIHCNKGKHRTGCLIACLRKMQSWDHATACEEYRTHSFPKSRTMDEDFIQAFDTTTVWDEIEIEHLPTVLHLCPPACTGSTSDSI